LRDEFTSAIGAFLIDTGIEIQIANLEARFGWVAAYGKRRKRRWEIAGSRHRSRIRHGNIWRQHVFFVALVRQY
jgi:hypothetical protein